MDEEKKPIKIEIPKEPVEWKGGDLAMDEGAILEVPMKKDGGVELPGPVAFETGSAVLEIQEDVKP